MALVMLKKARAASFRRTVRNETGDVLAVLEFDPGQPVDVPLNCLAGLQPDFYKTLFPVSLGPTGKPEIVPQEEFDLEAVLTAPEPVPVPVVLAPVAPVNNAPPVEPVRTDEKSNTKRHR